MTNPQFEPLIPAPIDLKSAITQLMSMNDDDFKDLIVDLDIKADVEGNIVTRTGEFVAHISPLYSEALRTADVCERWYQTLVQMKKSTEMTMAAKARDTKAAAAELEMGSIGPFGRAMPGDRDAATRERVRFIKWQANALRFLTGVEKRLAEASKCRRVHYGNVLPSMVADERDRLSMQVHQLTDAIRAHRDEYLSHADDEPSSADVALWSVLGD